MQLVQLKHTKFTGTTPDSPANLPKNIQLTQDKIAYAEALVDRFDGSGQDRDVVIGPGEPDGGVSLVAQKRSVQVRTLDDGTRQYSLTNFERKNGLLRHESTYVHELIEVAPDGKTEVGIYTTDYTDGGYLTGWLLSTDTKRSSQTFSF